MALHKSSDIRALALHAAVYGLFSCWGGFWFAVATCALHGLVDACTSRITKRLWASGRQYGFFAVIGADQAVHLTILVVTYRMLVH